ncbi:HU family DNA-binding protein [Butyricimonas synergistica]|uniref:HU family DNA-binding protein n=1 Tax=Butyricimonas synergistica TaxID=544644 RepID=UPI00035DA102|nr:HU family DNA-binding protein [Butyricimonas synergistica]
MNKLELIKTASEKSGVSRAETAKVLAAILDTIKESLKNDEPVRLQELGTFNVKNQKARNGYNPSSKKMMVIPAKKVIRFNPSKNIGI